MRLVLRKSAWLEDWFVVERAEHDGRTWLEPLDDGGDGGPAVAMLMRSARVSDAEVEGTAAEMLDLAAAIEARSRATHKRCAVDATRDPVELWSPRNSIEAGRVPLADAVELAKLIRATVAP